MKFLWVTRFLAVALILGGVGGAVMSILTISQSSQQFWLDIVVMGLYVSAVVIGVLLWMSRGFSKVLAAALFALQIPIVSSPNFSYEWFTGIAIKYFGNNGSYSWAVELGGANNLLLQSNVPAVFYGCNTFAVAALMYLLIVQIQESHRLR